MPVPRHVTHASLAIRITPVVKRSEYLDAMTFQTYRRPLFTEIFGPLIGLKEEWAEQGATPAELDLSMYRYRAPMRAAIPVNTGWLGGAPAELLEETDRYQWIRDSMGRTLKLCKGYATLPLPLDYPVKTMDDWLRVKPHYLFTEERLAGDWERLTQERLAEGYAIVAGIPGGFDEPRQLMGEEALCVAYYEQPELIHDMLNTFADTAFRVLERVSAAVPVDELSIHEDLAGKSGPLAGPSQIREFLKPYYRRIWDMLQERGARLFSQDSDGNMNAVIEPFLECGVNLMYPMEPAAGMDIVAVRRQYGARLAFMGGIDKHVLRRSTAEIDAELEYKLPPMVRTGGCILALDHRIPNGTPLAAYRYYIRRVWEILDAETARL